MHFPLLIAVLLLAGAQAQGDDSYETEMSDFMSLVPDPDEVDIESRNIFDDDDSEDVLSLLAKDEDEGAEHGEWNKCDNDLSEPRGLDRVWDNIAWLWKSVSNIFPSCKPQDQMKFYLFKREFPDCGRELDFKKDKKWRHSGFNGSLPTRVIIHGWMSQSRGTFNRDVKNAYLKLGDYNVIVTDWSGSSANLFYPSVVKLVDKMGAQLGQFTKELHSRFNARYDDMYLIGHSLGAQIAGFAGKFLKPEQYNTIFALDPAGPLFRSRNPELRLNASDAKYVESMHTSSNFGFLKPTGSATFYPNYGRTQPKCLALGCSHIRAYLMFAESIISSTGFWGTPCKRVGRQWQCDQSQRQAHRMGGEPSVPKSGIFYVKTSSEDPFALGP